MVWLQKTLIMFLLRRLLSAFLALAFASYGAVASATVHAHAASDHHHNILHSLAQDFVADDNHGDEGNAHAHSNDMEHETVTASGATPQSGEQEQAVVFHAHAVAAFTTVAEPLVLRQLFLVPLKRDIPRSTVPVSGLFSPLLKPPRTFL